jgi:hypothetical protein
MDHFTSLQPEQSIIIPKSVHPNELEGSHYSLRVDLCIAEQINSSPLRTISSIESALIIPKPSTGTLKRIRRKLFAVCGIQEKGDINRTHVSEIEADLEDRICEKIEEPQHFDTKSDKCFDLLEFGEISPTE